MKPTVLLLIQAMVVLTTPSIAQNGKAQLQTVGVISLTNSDGRMVSRSRDTIERTFFTSDTCTILYNQTLKMEERFMCVLQRMDGGESRAYSFNSAILSAGLKKAIEKLPAGTLVTIMITKNGSLASQHRTLQIVLK